MASRIYLLLLLICLACPNVQGQTNKKIRSLQREQTSLKKKIAGDETLLRSTKKDVNAQLANLQIIGAQIEGQKKKIGEIHSEIDTLSGEIKSLESRLSRLEADLAQCQRKYRHAINYMYRNRVQLSKWQFILSAKNFREMYRRMRYMTQFSKYQQRQGEYIRKVEERVKAERAALLGKKKEKGRLLAEGKAEQERLLTTQEERKTVVAQLNKKQKQLQASIAQQKKKYQSLNARIDKLIQEEIAAAERRRKAEAERKRKAEAERQAKLKRERERAEANARRGKSSKSKTSKSKAKNSGGTTATPRFNDADDADRALNGSFEANRGRLPIPITGSYAITSRYGRYNVEGLHGVQLDSKGINLTGKPGAQARSVFNGEVTAIFSYAGLYNVIVRHGSYMTVYCNLSTTSVRRGQKVNARQVLGRVATDASGNCTLHFQLRKETSKLNPEAWLGR